MKNSRRAWVLATMLSVAASSAVADTDPKVKLDPEQPSGSVPIAMDHLENYTTGMLISYLEVVSRGGGADAQANAAKVASFLSQTDPNWRVSAATQFAARATAAASTRARSRLKKPDAGTASTTPTPTPTVTPTSGGSSNAVAAPSSTPSVAASVAPPTPVPTATASATTEPEVEVVEPTPAPTRVARLDWTSFAEGQMREFWTADRDAPGAAPKGMIYDPRTGQLVKLDDHQKAVGMRDAFSDELANTVNAGTLKRIKDK